MGSNTEELRKIDNDAAFNLLAEWWMNTVQALVDSAGHDEALTFLKPYHMNAGRASAHVLNNELGLDPTDPDSSLFATKVALHFTHRKDDTICTRFERGTIVEVTDCPFKSGPMEVCDTFCVINTKEFSDTFAQGYPPYIIDLRNRLSNGDQFCRWVSAPSPFGPPKDISELGKPISMTTRMSFPQEIIDSFAIQYLGEFWVMATRAFIDHAGGDAAAVYTRPYMEHSGIAFALKYMNTLDNSGNTDLKSITGCISSCELALKMEQKSLEQLPTRSEGIITDCPFKDAPTEVCAQFESFCNGICQAINPEYEFVYRKTMTRGDKVCQWVIGKKGSNIVEDTVPEESSIELLKKRFAQGELTEEEYRRIRKVLEE